MISKILNDTICQNQQQTKAVKDHKSNNSRNNNTNYHLTASVRQQMIAHSLPALQHQSNRETSSNQDHQTNEGSGCGECKGVRVCGERKRREEGEREERRQRNKGATVTLLLLSSYLVQTTIEIIDKGVICFDSFDVSAMPVHSKAVCHANNESSKQQ